MIPFIQAHATAITFALAYVGIAAVSALPKPDDPRPFGQKFYHFLYDLLHILSNRAIERNPKLDPTPAKP